MSPHSKRIGLFFDNVQNWLPILHRPQFCAKYLKPNGKSFRIIHRDQVDDHEVVLINCVFALAARFSKASFFVDSDVCMRGDVFAQRAAAIKDIILKAIEEPPLDFVKACALLAFYDLASGQTLPGALLTSLCVRFAYDLGLDEIDHEYDVNGSLCGQPVDFEDVDAWVQKEEIRRLWWSIYELDCFVATLSCQPYGIERGAIKVFLPVSDHQWFNRIPLRSSFLIQDPSETWKSLKGCQNQSPRAWYLVTNYLKSCFADTDRQARRNTIEAQTELENALVCLKHALPPEFQLRTLNIDESNFRVGNWIISTNLMVLS